MLVSLVNLLMIIADVERWIKLHVSINMDGGVCVWRTLSTSPALSLFFCLVCVCVCNQIAGSVFTCSEKYLETD